jgi:hypothetical protein
MKPEGSPGGFEPQDPNNPSEEEIEATLFLTGFTTSTRDMKETLEGLSQAKSHVLKQGFLESSRSFRSRRMNKAKESLLNLLSIAKINLDAVALDSIELENVKDPAALKRMLDAVASKLRTEAEKEKNALKDSKGLHHPQGFFILTTLASEISLLKSAYLWEPGNK